MRLSYTLATLASRDASPHPGGRVIALTLVGGSELTDLSTGRGEP